MVVNIRMRGKQGVFFTIASILFIGALMLIFSTNEDVRPPDTRAQTVYVIDAFRERVENQYVPIVVRQSGYLGLYAMATDAANQAVPEYLVIAADFPSALTSGTYRGSDGVSRTLSGYQTLSQALSNLSAAANRTGYNLTMQLNGVWINQTGAFQAAIGYNVSFNLSSKDGSVRFQRNITGLTTTSLIGLPDLLYNNRAGALGLNPRTRVLQQYQPRRWNNTEFQSMTQSGSYYITAEGPSYFNRLQNSFVNSTYGVESMVNETAPMAATNLTSVDWQYFISKEFSCTYQPPVAFFVPGLRLSIYSITQYNITGATLQYNGLGTCAPAP